VADAYLAWSLMLLRFGGVDVGEWPVLAAYLERIRQRPSVAQAVALEQKLRKEIARP
jgi:glutathione S-transferase